MALAKRIVFDARVIQGQMHGIARYAEELLRNLPLTPAEKLYVFYFPTYFKRWSAPQIHWIPLQSKPLSLQETPEVLKLLYKIRPQLYHTPSFARPLHLPCPWVMTLHDLIHIHTPQDYGLKQRLYYQWLAGRLPQARGVITVSETSKKAIQSWCPGIQRIYVTALGSSLPAPVNLSLKIKRPFLLYVGNAKPHKNFNLLWKAFESWGVEQGVSLVAVGVPPRALKNAYFYQAISDDLLAALYHAADMVVVPSLEEGFGLPLLEAMTLGKTLLVSDIPVFREIAQDAAFYFNPTRVESLIAALNMAMQVPDLRQARQSLGLKRAQAFSWQQLAEKTLKVYQDCSV